MVCLRDIKYLTKKKVLAMQPIYYACFPIKVGIEYMHKPQVIKLEGDRLKRALDEPFFYTTIIKCLQLNKKRGIC